MTSTTPEHQQSHLLLQEQAPPADEQQPHHQVQVWAPSPHQQLPGPYLPHPVAPSAPVEPQAVVSLVLGGVSLLTCLVPGISLAAFVGAVAAVITGIVALRRLGTAERSGKGLAITGLSCGGVAVVGAGVMSAFFILYVTVFGGLWTLAWGSAFSQLG
ncbi:DUF4190 domain-containing protein [Streptomyces sp. NP160]|uniref:DUF4190 domain-containing protein n=1 Tax=Streptomyces sp. NP160 TaxID=2586637 RepID=UPI0011191A1B|nr:DUF4190 domain-containing protein [Streptomyces sp. NP160]TNM63267.1 DUF4190 domain-containing protein [Streptomyces sp. NP160]